VEYKRGKAQIDRQIDNSGIFEPHLIQLAAQCLALRENGFSCDEGMVYYILSGERVAVKFDSRLLDRTLALLADMRWTVQRGELPPPLQNSSRCDRCSMAGICLPDEVNLLREMKAEKGPKQEENQETNQERNQEGNPELGSECCLPAGTIRFLFMSSARGRRFAEGRASGGLVL
jgi:hypothetical protein